MLIDSKEVKCVNIAGAIDARRNRKVPRRDDQNLALAHSCIDTWGCKQTLLPDGMDTSEQNHPSELFGV